MTIALDIPRSVPLDDPEAYLHTTIAKVGVVWPITRFNDICYITLWNYCWLTPPRVCSINWCFSVTYRQYNAMAEACDIVVIVGNDYLDLGVGAYPTETFGQRSHRGQLGSAYAARGECQCPQPRPPFVGVVLSVVFLRDWPPRVPTPRWWWPTGTT